MPHTSPPNPLFPFILISPIRPHTLTLFFRNVSRFDPQPRISISTRQSSRSTTTRAQSWTSNSSWSIHAYPTPLLSPSWFDISFNNKHSIWHVGHVNYWTCIPWLSLSQLPSSRFHSTAFLWTERVFKSILQQTYLQFAQYSERAEMNRCLILTAVIYSSCAILLLCLLYNFLVVSRRQTQRRDSVLFMLDVNYAFVFLQTHVRCTEIDTNHHTRRERLIPLGIAHIYA